MAAGKSQPGIIIPRYIETGVGGGAAGMNPGTAASAIDRIVFLRMFTPTPFPLARIVFRNAGTAAGNFDTGIYAYGTGVVSRLGSSGLVAQSGINADQAYTVSCLIPVGEFYIAYVVSDVTSTIHRAAPTTTFSLTGRMMFYIANVGALPTSVDTTTPVVHSIYPYIRLERN